MTERKQLKAGDRVRLKGFGNVPINGYSVSVEGVKTVIVEVGDPCLVVHQDGESLEVFPSQCRRLVKRKRREWAGKWVTRHMSDGNSPRLVFEPDDPQPLRPEVGTFMRLREVRPKPKAQTLTREELGDLYNARRAEEREKDGPPQCADAGRPYDAMGECSALRCLEHGKGKA